MSGHAVRFRPPRVEATPALAWVLARSLGPVASVGEEESGASGPAPGPAPGAEESADRIALARRFRLGARLAARQPRAVLDAELGAASAAELLAERRTAVAADMAWSVVARDLAQAAAEAGIAIAFLKYHGLRLAGVVEAGARTAADCDLLVAPEECGALAEVLLGGGFTRSSTRDQEHQLPPLYHPTGAAVEIHRVVLGVQLGRDPKRSATLHDLRASPPSEGSALLVPIAHLPGLAFHPSRPVLAAHALVHGIAQHGWAPHAYPALRMVADLLDLGLGGPAGEELLATFAPWIARAVPTGEARAALELVRALQAGDLSPLHADPARAGGASALLHHLLAGALDADYRSALRIPMLLRPLTDRAAPVGALVSIGRALVPGAGEMDLLHGAAGGGSGDAAPGSSDTPRSHWRSYITRPFSLLARLVRYARAAFAARRKGARGG